MNARRYCVAAIALMLIAPVGWAQQPPEKPVDQKPETPKPPDTKPPGDTADAKSDQKSAIKYRVIEINPNVQRAPIGTEPKNDKDWIAVKVGDEITPGQQIRTSMRSTVKLAMEPAAPPSVVMIERDSLVAIDELFKKKDPAGKDVAVSRLGVAYGAVRAGVAEGEVRSDMEIRSPVATLAKRGTWDFRIFVERGTGRFEISLAERGLVQAIQNATGQRVTINPGQAVNQAMSRWIETMRFTRPVNVQDWYGLRGTELIFNLSTQTGLGVLVPGGNPVAILNVSGGEGQQLLANVINQQVQDLQSNPNVVNSKLSQNRAGAEMLFGPRRRPEGNFGVGQTTVPLLIDPNNPLVQKGYAQPGRMDFYKSDLANFVKQQQAGQRPK